MVTDKALKIGEMDVDAWLEDIEDVKEQEVDLIKYETKVVAFLDLLGMTNLILKKTNGEEQEAIRLIEKIRGIIEKETKYFNAESQFTLLYISDSFIFACEPEWLIKLIELLATIQMRILLECNFQLRGAVTLGDVIIREYGKHIIGPAYIDAYLLQEKNAIYPRIILHRSIVEQIDISGYEDFIFSDDNEMCIDYLGYYIRNEGKSLPEIAKRLGREKLFDHLVDQYNEWNSKNQYSVKQKFGWTIRYLEKKGVWPSGARHKYY